MASPWADQPVRTLPCNQPLGSTGDSATANAALLDSATSYHVSTAISSQQGSKNTSSLLRPTSLSRQQTVPSSSYTAGSPQAAFDDSEYHLAVPFPQWHQQKATGSSVAGLEGGRYGQKPVDHRATNLVGLPRPFRSYHEKLHFVSTLSTCINSITLFTSRDVDQIFQLLGRQLRRKDTQYNRTVDDASLSHMSLIVFLDKGKLAKEYWDSADVVEELEGIYPGLLKVLRFPSWDAGQHDLLQICIKVLPKVPPVGRYGIESFEWFIWHVANQQLYQGHYSSVSGDVDVFWGGLQPEGYTNVPLEIKPGFSTSWFRDNISALSVGPFIDVAAQASRVKPRTLRLLTFDGRVLPGEFHNLGCSYARRYILLSYMSHEIVRKVPYLYGVRAQAEACFGHLRSQVLR
ncbi:hypothetical protein LTR70_003268 [Exophiala xenobiotica]|uniref:Fungal-type protein kinase domain-containing protein n=1 Tax=Lithohypha guttulata TaxID=1690604 RepID=A0ABR0KMM4_9EURO|nr:hypothetical protein LTR24_001143 [Lithohypha guttulata]KAK5323590.1 hypothetical protein LTR70_003268 [Exophiala xenobiotica]